MSLTVILYTWLNLSLACFGYQSANQQSQGTKIATNKTIEPKASKSGIASFYHNKFVGKKTATGEVFSNTQYTAASNHFSLGTYVKVTNLDNNRFVYVKINDRMGPSSKSNIDLSKIAAQDLLLVSKGKGKVKIESVTVEEGKRKILAQANENGQLADNEL